jgi:hypothetical protein
LSAKKLKSSSESFVDEAGALVDAGAAGNGVGARRRRDGRRGRSGRARRGRGRFLVGELKLRHKKKTEKEMKSETRGKL